mgnify:CR=1 FL=1
MTADWLSPPPWLSPEAQALAGQLLSSHQRAFGTPLLAGLAADASPGLIAQELFAAEVVVLAHDGADPNSEPGPRLIYANRAALRLWRRPWGAMVGMPSRLTAEPAERAKTRFGVERSQAHLVRFVVQLVAEVVETRLGNRLRLEHREIERQRRRKVAHALAHRDDVVGQLRRGQIVNMDRGRSAVHGAPLPRSHVRTPDRRRPRLGPTG